MSGIFTPVNLSIAWILLAFVYSWIIKKSSSKSQSIWFILGGIGLVLFISKFFELWVVSAGSTLSDYLSIPSDLRLAKVYFYNTLEWILVLTFCLSLNKKLREIKVLKYCQVFLMMIFLIYNFWFLGFQQFGYATSVIPGAETTIIDAGNFYGSTICFIVLLSVDWFLQKKRA